MHLNAVHILVTRHGLLEQNPTACLLSDQGNGLVLLHTRAEHQQEPVQVQFSEVSADIFLSITRQISLFSIFTIFSRKQITSLSEPRLLYITKMNKPWCRCGAVQTVAHIVNVNYCSYEQQLTAVASSQQLNTGYFFVVLKYLITFYVLKQF